MRLFRYRRIDLFFCFSFFIAFSCLWFSFFSAGKEEQYRIDAERYSYGSNALLSVENMEESIDIEQLTESINGVVYIKDFSLYYDTVDEEILSRIILSGGEELRLPVEDHKVELEKGILIGRNQSKARFLSKGGVLVDGSRIDFAGITGCKYSGYGSYEIIVPYRLLGDKTKERIKHTSSLSIVVSSEENDAYERAMTIKTKLENLSPGCEVMVNSYSESKVDEKTHGDTTLMMLLTVFTFLACFIASELWMRTRTNELSILMIYGYKWWPKSIGTLRIIRGAIHRSKGGVSGRTTTPTVVNRNIMGCTAHTSGTTPCSTHTRKKLPRRWKTILPRKELPELSICAVLREMPVGCMCISSRCSKFARN